MNLNTVCSLEIWAINQQRLTNTSCTAGASLFYRLHVKNVYFLQSDGTDKVFG